MKLALYIFFFFKEQGLTEIIKIVIFHKEKMQHVYLKKHFYFEFSTT